MLSFREVAHHQMLGRTISQLGETAFWRSLIGLLREWVAFDNALVTRLPPTGAPQWLEEVDLVPAQAPSPVPRYLDGMYLLDPFFLACHEGLPDGLYRLEDVAPDRFRDSEYFLSYFRTAVGEDEHQFLVGTVSGMLCLSLGKPARFTSDETGALLLAAPWVLSLMRQHGQRGAAAPTGNDALAEQVQDALSRFGTAVLSERETEIARLILRGYSSKGIADKLGISPETVKVHRRHLYTKLDISSQPELFSLFLMALGHDPVRP